jgi:hypothetical protein
VRSGNNKRFQVFGGSMRRIFLFFVLNIVLFFTPVLADENTEDARFDGQLTFMVEGEKYQIEDLPRFRDFPAEKKVSGKIAADIDWSSHKSAWNFRTRLRKGLKKGANFNGHYAVITHGCGSPCQVNWIVDVNNGKVVGGMGTSLGAVYYKDSSLIVGNLASEEQLQEYIDAGSAVINHIEFYKVENGKMIEIKNLEVYKMLNDLKKK